MSRHAALLLIALAGCEPPAPIVDAGSDAGTAVDALDARDALLTPDAAPMRQPCASPDVCFDWAVPFGEAVEPWISAVCTDDSGVVVLGGTSRGRDTVTIEGRVVSRDRMGVGFIARFDTSGELLASASIDPTTTEDILGACSILPGGDVIAVGADAIPFVENDVGAMLVARFGRDGALAWMDPNATDAPARTGASANGVVTSPTGRAFLAGYAEVAPAGSTGDASGGIVAELDPVDGHFLWSRVYAGLSAMQSIAYVHDRLYVLVLLHSSTAQTVDIGMLGHVDLVPDERMGLVLEVDPTDGTPSAFLPIRLGDGTYLEAAMESDGELLWMVSRESNGGAVYELALDLSASTLAIDLRQPFRLMGATRFGTDRWLVTGMGDGAYGGQTLGGTWMMLVDADQHALLAEQTPPDLVFEMSVGGHIGNRAYLFGTPAAAFDFGGFTFDAPSESVDSDFYVMQLHDPR